MMILHCAQFELTLTRPHVMGIVNVTPDSFSDGGHFVHTSAAVEHAFALVEQGADILDVGGESTRPNATPVALQEELDRVIPVIEVLSRHVKVPISIDTYKPAVMVEAIRAGASIVNDVRALQELGAMQAVASSKVGVCLMHMQGTPQTMQIDPVYTHVVDEVKSFLAERAAACLAAGIAKERIMLDPGFGFGKTRAHNIQLIQELANLQSLGYPLLVGLSRKSVLGQVTGQDVDARLHASVAAAVISAMKGANIVRVHDVKATVEALKVVTAIL
ncbi:Dihydropteroate synthase [Methylophilaceae bacterium 11]|nr:Dihydropteroate synthase [Methylophilaceae bacterium 11]